MKNQQANVHYITKFPFNTLKNLNKMLDRNNDKNKPFNYTIHQIFILSAVLKGTKNPNINENQFMFF